MKEIIVQIKELQLPENEFVVLGSGIMSVLGIREHSDIDLLVSHTVFEDLRAKGWESKIITVDGRNKEILSSGIVDTTTDFIWSGGEITLQDTEKTIVIEHIKFISLETLLQIKTDMARKKDLTDVFLIKEYLLQNSQ